MTRTPEITDRTRAWAATMHGHGSDVVDLVQAHRDSGRHRLELDGPVTREVREAREDALLAPGATRSGGAGRRARAEAPDPERMCFERDRDRIIHSTAFRRLAGKTQVVVHPSDHQRTRLTHALEVAQVAVSIARGVGANVALTEAIALGHDCGHGPGGHASEDAFDPYIPGGFDHAPWGADVTLAPLNLCAETLDGVRNHSWSRPAPATVEGEIVSWADRIAYCAHDLEDAVHVGLVDAADLPDEIAEVCGRDRRSQISILVRAVIATTVATGLVGMPAREAAALAAFRRFNYERIYTRPEAVEQSTAVIRVLRALVEHYLAAPHLVPAAALADITAAECLEAGAPETARAIVTWVGGMTDRYAFDTAVREVGFDPAALPRGIDRRG